MPLTLAVQGRQSGYVPHTPSTHGPTRLTIPWLVCPRSRTARQSWSASSIRRGVGYPVEAPGRLGGPPPRSRSRDREHELAAQVSCLYGGERGGGCFEW